VSFGLGNLRRGQAVGGECIVERFERVREKRHDTAYLVGVTGAGGAVALARGHQAPEVQQRMRRTDASLRAETQGKAFRSDRDLTEHECERGRSGR